MLNTLKSPSQNSLLASNNLYSSVFFLPFASFSPDIIVLKPSRVHWALALPSALCTQPPGIVSAICNPLILDTYKFVTCPDISSVLHRKKEITCVPNLKQPKPGLLKNQLFHPLICPLHSAIWSQHVAICEGLFSMYSFYIKPSGTSCYLQNQLQIHAAPPSSLSLF